MKGQLSEIPFGEVLSELYRTQENGILTVNRDKQTKAIFIEQGSAVFAISNCPEDQLGPLLVEQGRLNAVQLTELGTGINTQQLAQQLLEKALIANTELDAILQQLITNTILAIFEWPQGEFSFEKKERARLVTKLRLSTPSIILAGIRKKAPLTSIRNLSLHAEHKLKPINNPNLLNNIHLESMEGYILSRIVEPMDLQMAISLIGLPEEQSLTGIYALCLAGLLELESFVPATRPRHASTSVPTSAPAAAPEEFNEAKLQQEVTRMLAFFASADFYEILGVTRRAAESEIKKSYYQLAKKYHPDRARKGSAPNLKADLEKVFAKISEAYETLKSTETRGHYDDKIRHRAERTPVPSRVPTQSTPSPPPTPLRPQPQPTPPPTQPVNRSVPSVPVSQPIPQSVAPQVTRPVSTPPVATQQTTPMTTSTVSTTEPKTDKAEKPLDVAEVSFAQGKQAFERRDYVRAAYLLREAVNINPSNTVYRQQLAQTLIKNVKWHKEAEDNLLKLIQAEPFNPNNHIMLGLVYKEAGLPKRAATEFKEALSLDSKNKVARRELALLGDVGDDKKGASFKGTYLLDKLRALPTNLQYLIVGIILLAVLLWLYTRFS